MKISTLDFKRHSGLLLGLDASYKTVHIFNDQGAYQRSIDLSVSKPARISSISCMAVDSMGRLYIGDAGAGDVKVFSLSGMFLMAITLPPDAEGKIARMAPTAMTVLSDGALAVIEEEARNLILFERTGEFREALALGGAMIPLQNSSRFRTVAISAMTRISARFIAGPAKES